MKNTLQFILIFIFSINCFSQSNFERGYFINNENEKTDCFIKNLDWKNNPKEFVYKLSNTSNPKTATIETVKEFSILNTHKYNRYQVQIDRSSKNINHLDTVRTPLFHKEELFLKTLVAGKATLYKYEDNFVKRFFLKVDSSQVTQLIHKEYIRPYESVLRQNNKYRQQLWNNLKCQNIHMQDLKKINYKEKDLVNLFLKYSKCNNSEFKSFDESGKKDLLNLTMRFGLNSSSLSINYIESDLGDVDFGNYLGFRTGLEIEYIMPFNNNKWSVILEPTYQYYKSNKETQNQTVTSDYKSIELSIGLRHYLFLSDNSKIFINGLYVRDFTLDSKIEFENGENLTLEQDDSLEIFGTSNLAVGCGYNFNNKYIVEIRYGFNREILNLYQKRWNSKYNTLSIIFGYTIF